MKRSKNFIAYILSNEIPFLARNDEEFMANLQLRLRFITGATRLTTVPSREHHCRLSAVSQAPPPYILIPTGCRRNVGEKTHESCSETFRRPTRRRNPHSQAPQRAKFFIDSLKTADRSFNLTRNLFMSYKKIKPQGIAITSEIMQWSS